MGAIANSTRAEKDIIPAGHKVNGDGPTYGIARVIRVVTILSCSTVVLIAMPLATNVIIYLFGGTTAVGTVAAGTAVAGTAVAGTAVAGTAAAGTAAAGTAAAGTVAAGTAASALITAVGSSVALGGIATKF